MSDQQPLAVTPESLKATADHLADVSSKMKNVLSTLQSSLSAKGAPWGNDEPGRNFAEGSNGYVAQEDWVFGSIQAKTDLLDTYSTQMHETANSLEQQDNT